MSPDALAAAGATRWWRAGLFSLALGCALLLVWSATRLERSFEPGLAGTLGVQLGPIDGAQRNRIKSLEIDSPLAVAGAGVGDQVALDHQSDRWRFLGTDETIALSLFQGDSSRRLALRPIADANVLAHPVAVQARSEDVV